MLSSSLVLNDVCGAFSCSMLKDLSYTGKMTNAFHG